MSQLQMPNQGALEYDNSNEAGDRGVIYDPTDSNNSTFFYWVTSRLNSQDDNNQDGVARNGFWNTKQKINQDESIDAIINFESKFPDDKYIVWSVGKDIEGNGGDLENRVGADSQSVTIDNFMPYVQSVSILQGLNVFYGAAWPVTAQSEKILSNSFASTLLNSLENNNGNGLFISINFSEKMDPAFAPVISLQFSNGSISTVTAAGSWTSSPEVQTWGVNTQAGIIPQSYSGPVTVLISGAKDLAGNSINPMPQTIAIRNSLGDAWVNSITGQSIILGSDANHVFQVADGTPTSTPTNTSTNTPAITVTSPTPAFTFIPTRTETLVPTGTVSTTPTPSCANGWCFTGVRPADSDGVFVGFKDQLLIYSIGGLVGSSLSIWTSSDGSSWSENPNPEYGFQFTPPWEDPVTWLQNFPNIRGYSISLFGAPFVFHDKLWFRIDYGPDGESPWFTSSDGNHWNFAAFPGTGSSDISGPINAFDGGIVGMGGCNTYPYTADLCSNSGLLAGDPVVSQGALRLNFVPFSPPGWGGRTNSILYSFNGQMFMMGGAAKDAVYTDIWSTSDGTHWTQRANTVPMGDVLLKITDFSKQYIYYTRPVEYANRVWMLAGEADIVDGVSYVTPYLWMSSDGVNWGVVDSDPPDVGDLVYAGNKLWLSGADGIWSYQLNGVPTIIPTNDLTPAATRTFTPTATFSPTISSTATSSFTSTFTPTITSTDTPLDSDWKQTNSNPGFDPRENAQAVAAGGQMILVGGLGSLNNDVWVSSDGASWSAATTAAGFSGRFGHTSLAFNSELWVIGGFDGTSRSDVWSSSDKINWNEPTANAAFGARHLHTSVVFNPSTGSDQDGKMWVIGGVDDSNGPKNDVWSSSDGISWNQSIANAPWSARYSHASYVMGGKIWVVGGTDGTHLFNDVWSSFDGQTWTRATNSADFSARKGLSGVVYNGAAYVIGGQDANGFLNDMWYSYDGAIWKKSVLKNGQFTARANHSSVVFNNAIWVIAGNSGTRMNDVWFAPPPAATSTFTPSPTPTFTITKTPTPVVLSCQFLSSLSVTIPRGVAVDSQGNVCAIGLLNNQVFVFDSLGNSLSSWGQTGSDDGDFTSPTGIGVDLNGLVYISDGNLNRIQVFGEGGNYIRKWGAQGVGNGNLKGPAGIAVSPQTQVYVADTGNARIEVFNSQGGYVAKWGHSVTGGNGNFITPVGVALDYAGNVYVSDSGTSLVQVFSSLGAFMYQWDVRQGTALNGANMIALDHHGLVYVSDGAGEVGVFGENGSVVGTVVSGATQLRQTAGVGAFAGDGTWYVASQDSGLGSLKKFKACAFLATPTFTSTAIPTSTNSSTNTLTPVVTPTSSNTPTNTITNTMSPTATNSQTETGTDTPTFTTTKTSTNTPILTATKTFTSTATNSSTNTPTDTATKTATNTLTNTPTATKTPANSSTNTPTISPTKTSSNSPTKTPTMMSTNTSTRTPTNTSVPGSTNTFTKTPTRTPTNTPTKTPTKTPTPTITLTVTKTLTPTPTVVCGTNNTALTLLEEYTSSCAANSVYHLFAIINNGAAVTLSDITIKFWPYDTSGVNLMGQITTGGCIWNPTCSHNVTGTTMSAIHFTPACGPTTTQMANWEMTMATTDNTVLSGGTSWVGLQTLVTRSDSQPFVPGTSFWYSPCVNAIAYSTNTHFAIYLRGNLVTAAGGFPPSCRPLATCTPNGGAAPIALRNGSESDITPTITPTPMVQPNQGLIESVAAAPNVSDCQQPIRFLLKLNKTAQVSLKLFTLTGEQAYGTQSQGNQGVNTIVWNARNNEGHSVASGLYQYLLQVEDGFTPEIRRGKIVILR